MISIMKELYKKFTCSGLLFMSVFTSVLSPEAMAQEFAKEQVLNMEKASDSLEDGLHVIEKAMQDELKRSMEELSYEDYNKPFFISYSINDIEGISITSSLGAILYSNQLPVRNKSVRVLVGDYDFNDESLDVAYYNEPTSLSEIHIPIEDDYFGIRRSLWVSTDAVYKSAARLFKENKQYLQEKNVTLEKLPHRKFAKAPVINLGIEKEFSKPDLEQLEALTKELSAMFSEEPDIHHSMVSLNAFNSTNYFVNSEGTRVRYPYSITTLQVYAEIKTDDGESIIDQFVHYGFTPSTLPNIEFLKGDVRALIDGLKILKETKVFKDSYIGPVLFVNEAVGSVFANSLFGYDGLMTANDISTRDNYRYHGQFLDDKIGNRILPRGLSVVSMPKLEYYDNKPLPGSFKVDAEGVVPSDTLQLVENGNLIALLNSRTYTTENPVLNGHSNANQAIGPGVIKIGVENKSTVADLKKELVRNAKEIGLPYALMVKRIPYGNYMGVNVYKVSLEDGSEELLRLAQVKPLDIKSLRRILGGSNSEYVFNNQSGGSITSYIVPGALLVDEVEVEGSSAPYLGNKVLVENPVGQKE